MKQPFDPDVFMGKLLKWIVKKDQPFSVVDDEDFIDMLEYLKKDITVVARRTLMRRLEEFDDIYIGIELAVEKLDHYYDKISPIAGIALILDPRKKKDFLKDNLDWSAEWAVEQLLVYSPTATAEQLNVGNAMANDLKYFIKLGRMKHIHGSPTVLVNGIENPTVSSSWKAAEWQPFFKSLL
ncbi:hypothetical protein HDV03_003414 [Kappamyces sp. JEL0829]|nr:hypothetical protein HDV03_003414 [Kappamyces sp. JEL0829]